MKISRRTLLGYSPLLLLPSVSACGITRIDPWHFLIRSPHIDTLEQEKEIRGRAKLARTQDGRIRVLYVSGSPYERGYQHGALLREEIADNFYYIQRQARKVFHFDELFNEVYERVRPFIPQEYVEEMHGIAHGARMPLQVIHQCHILPSIGEWGGRKKIRKIIKQMMAGELGTSCSNYAVGGSATIDGNFYAVRILDWGMHRISKLHQYPLITVQVPEQGLASANISWCGFVGAVSGMNEAGITLGEMGYGDPPNERLEGKPMIFMLRDVLAQARNLSDVRKIITESIPTDSYVFLMTDGKTRESEMYVRDPDRFVVFQPGTEVKDKKDYYPPINDTLFGGHYEDVMTSLLQTNHGKISPEMIMQELIPKMAMKSNFQNVIYEPSALKFWVNNAKSKHIGAHTQPYSHFDFGGELDVFRNALKG